jgi:hypothetical protein
MSKTLSIEVNFPIGSYAFARNGHDGVTRIKIARIAAVWQGETCHVVYTPVGRPHITYKPEDLFPTADAAFEGKELTSDPEEGEDDEDIED